MVKILLKNHTRTVSIEYVKLEASVLLLLSQILELDLIMI
jgi:hypothetical protein